MIEKQKLSSPSRSERVRNGTRGVVRSGRSFLLVQHALAAKERDLVLERVDDVADDGEHDEEDYDYERDDDVAFDHFGEGGWKVEGLVDREGRRGGRRSRRLMALVWRWWG